MEMDARVPPIGQHGAFKVPSSPLSSRGRRKATSTSAMGMEVDLCLTALAVKHTRPGLRRPGGRLRGDGAPRAQLRLRGRQGRAKSSPGPERPPSSANTSIASMPGGAKATGHPRHRRQTKTPSDRLEIQFGVVGLRK